CRSTNDAGPASIAGNGVHAAATCIARGYSSIGSIRPPNTNSSFWTTQNTGDTSSSQNASRPIHRHTAVINAAPANPNGSVHASGASGGIQPVTAKAHAHAVAASSGA